MEKKRFYKHCNLPISKEATTSYKSARTTYTGKGGNTHFTPLLPLLKKLCYTNGKSKIQKAPRKQNRIEFERQLFWFFPH